MITRKEFLDYCWQKGKLENNTITLKIGDLLRLADKTCGAPSDEPLNIETIHIETIC